MSVTVPIEVYEVFEESFGKEKALKMISGLEKAISEATEYKWATTKGELVKELVTRDIFEERLNTLKAELVTRDMFENAVKHELVTRDMLEERLNTLKAELVTRDMFENAVKHELVTRDMLEERLNTLKAELKLDIGQLDRKFTIMFVILFFTIIFLNQNALEFLARILGLIK